MATAQVLNIIFSS